MKNITAATTAVFTLILASCAVNVSQEDQARSKTFTPRPDRANVYIYRPMNKGIGIIGGNARRLPLELNGKPAVLGPEPNQFTLLDVPPGRHAISTHGGGSAFAQVAGIKAGKADYQFFANKGENVFLQITPLFTVDVIVASTPVASWSRMSDSEGRGKIANSKLSADIEIVN